MSRALEDDDLLPLADALGDGAWHSGAALAAAAGVSRAALAKRIAHLQSWGLSIAAQAGVGYRMQPPLERLDETRIRAGLPDESAKSLRRLAIALRVDSTNQRLLEADPRADPQALFAEAQSAGRGRRGRDWHSPFGSNLYLSLAWTFPAWPAAIGTLPLAVGVACARALSAAGVDGIGIKWPNDLRIGEAKLGGILLEQRGEAAGSCRVVAGVGINVAMTAGQASGIDQAWTSVHAALSGQPAASRNALAAQVLGALLDAFNEFEQSGFAGFAADWSRLDISAGQAVRVTAGSEVIEGLACGIDAQGALRVETPDGQRHRLHAGEVSLRLARAS